MTESSGGREGLEEHVRDVGYRSQSPNFIILERMELEWENGVRNAIKSTAPVPHPSTARN